MNRRQIIATAAATAALGVLPFAAEAAPPRLLSSIGTPICMRITKHPEIINGRPEWVYRMIVSYDGAGDTVIQDERRFAQAWAEITEQVGPGRELVLHLAPEDLPKLQTIMGQA